MKKEKEFEKIYNEFKKQAFYISYSITEDYDESMDVVQEVFLKIYENMENIKEIKAYIMTVSRNMSLNKVRGNRHLLDIEDHEPVFNITPERECENRETMEQVRKAMSDLTAAEKNVFYMKFYSGFNYDEISKELNIAESTARVIFMNALKKVRGKCEV